MTAHSAAVATAWRHPWVRSCNLAHDGVAALLTKHAPVLLCHFREEPGTSQWGKGWSHVLPWREIRVWETLWQAHLWAANVQWSGQWKLHCCWDCGDCKQMCTASACPNQRSMLHRKALPFGYVRICMLLVVPLRRQCPPKGTGPWNHSEGLLSQAGAECLHAGAAQWGLVQHRGTRCVPWKQASMPRWHISVFNLVLPLHQGTLSG